MKYLAVGILCILSTGLFAQQTPIYSQYYMNPYLYNPAAAGDNGTQAYFLYRKQWVNIDGSPETHAFTIDGKLENQPIGLGLTFFNDESNVISRSSFGLSSAYSLKLTEDQSLAFGMTLQGIQHRVNFDKIIAEDVTDPNLLNSIDQKTAFELSAGLLYKWRRLKFGFAADQLLQNQISYEDASNFRTLNYNLVRHYISNISYDFEINDDFGVEPLLVTRIVQGLPSQFDANVIGKYKDILWTGIGYRHNLGWTFSAGFNLQQQMRFGYTYEIPSSDLDQIGGTTHEFVLGWRFSRGSGSSRPTGNQPLTPSRGYNDSQSQQMDELRYKNEKLAQELEESRDRHEAQENELNKLRDRVNSYEGELSELIAKSTEELDETPYAKYYVIISAFKTLEYTKKAQNLILQESGIRTRVIQNDTGSFYLIYSSEFDDLKTALEEAKRLDDGSLDEVIVGNPWVYQKDTDGK